MVKNILTSILLFVLPFLIYTLHDNFYPTTDSLPNNYTAVNLAYNRSINLNNISDEIYKHGLMGVTSSNKNNDVFSKTPILNGILAAPFFKTIDKINNIDSFDPNLLFNDYYQIVGKYYGSFITALTTPFVFISLFLISSNYLKSLLITLIYAFCTFTYGTVSQGNWEHAPSFLFYITSLLTLILYFKHQKLPYLLVSTVLVTLSYFIRPLNIVFVIALLLTLIYEKKFKHTILVLIISSIIFYVYTIITNIIGVPNGYKNEIIDSLANINFIYSLKVLGNILVSPNYGLFIFYPIFIFSLIGLIFFFVNFNKLKQNTEKYILIYSALIIAAIFFLDTIWWAWPGGYSWGPRLLTEATIPMVMFIMYFIEDIKKSYLIYVFISILSIHGLISNILCIYANNTEWHAIYMGAPSKYLISSWSRPNIIPFYLFDRRSLRTQELKHNQNGETYFHQNTYLIEYKNKRIIPIHESNILLYTKTQTTL